nr:hypothetical protein CFP56_64716 [Quercus suber]
MFLLRHMGQDLSNVNRSSIHPRPSSAPRAYHNSCPSALLCDSQAHSPAQTPSPSWNSVKCSADMACVSFVWPTSSGRDRHNACSLKRHYAHTLGTASTGSGYGVLIGASTISRLGRERCAVQWKSMEKRRSARLIGVQMVSRRACAPRGRATPQSPVARPYYSLSPGARRTACLKRSWKSGPAALQRPSSPPARSFTFSVLFAHVPSSISIVLIQGETELSHTCINHERGIASACEAKSCMPVSAFHKLDESTWIHQAVVEKLEVIDK